MWAEKPFFPVWAAYSESFLWVMKLIEFKSLLITLVWKGIYIRDSKVVQLIQRQNYYGIQLLGDYSMFHLKSFVTDLLST